jgi:ATP-binding cassette, subfamily B, bacterial PglK
MLETYRKLLDLLTSAERRKFYLLLVMIMVMGVVQMVSVASVLPFLGVLANPQLIETSDKLAWVYGRLGFTSHHAFLMFLGGAVFVVLVVGLLFKTATQYAIYRFATMRGYTVSKRLMQGYLRQPYAWFLNRHSADLGANILTDVSKVISQALMPAMKLLSHAAVVLFMVGLLVAVQPVAAVVLACLLGGSYGLIYLVVRRRLVRLGAERYAANLARFQTAGEAMGGIKEVKLMGLESALLRRFQIPAKRLAECDAQSAVIAEVPRYILEAVAFGSMLLFILAMLATGDGSVEELLPVLGIYAFAGLRLFPALQQLYASVTSLRFSRPTLDRVHRDVMENDANAAPWATGKTGMLHLARRLDLTGVHYAYPNAERAALGGLDMSIAARTTVGIVGGTGAGKTTTVDIILGLLRPQRGSLKVDGLEIGPDNQRAWQNAIGYVPQQIFLTDDSVRANIAFGLRPDQIDDAAVERAARVAELHDFVMRELPHGYETTVGERGVRLSGGQRQRIGIARALYHDPDVLILDEATSALDNLTERAVMDAVHNLGHAKTIILIAHRLSTVRSCDTIFMLEHGRVVAMGSYDELLDSSQQFRAMAAGA